MSHNHKHFHFSRNSYFSHANTVVKTNPLRYHYFSSTSRQLQNIDRTWLLYNKNDLKPISKIMFTSYTSLDNLISRQVLLMFRKHGNRLTTNIFQQFQDLQKPSVALCTYVNILLYCSCRRFVHIVRVARKLWNRKISFERTIRLQS